MKWSGRVCVSCFICAFLIVSNNNVNFDLIKSRLDWCLLRHRPSRSSVNAWLFGKHRRRDVNARDFSETILHSWVTVSLPEYFFLMCNLRRVCCIIHEPVNSWKGKIKENIYNYLARYKMLLLSKGTVPLHQMIAYLSFPAPPLYHCSCLAIVQWIVVQMKTNLAKIFVKAGRKSRIVLFTGKSLFKPTCSHNLKDGLKAVCLYIKFPYLFYPSVNIPLSCSQEVSCPHLGIGNGRCSLWHSLKTLCVASSMSAFEAKYVGYYIYG